MTITRVVVTGTIFEQRCENVLHFEHGGSTWSEVDYVNNFISDWFPILRNLQNNAWKWTQMSVQLNVSEVNPSVPLVFDISNQAGVLSGAPALSFVAGIFSLRTGFAGRRGRGRFYMAGVHGESILNGRLEPNAFGSYVNRANELKNRWCVGGTKPVKLVVWSRNRDEGAKDVLNILPRNVFGIQRRRNIGVGS